MSKYTDNELGSFLQANLSILEELKRKHLEESAEEKGPSYVRWGIVGIIAVVVTIVLGSLTIALDSRAEAVDATVAVSKLEGKVETSANDIQWIKESLSRIEQKLK
jgi:hypothetical protein